MKESFWKNTNVLVTGVHGFIGSNLCKDLIDKGAKVFGIHKNNSSESLLTLEKITKFNSLSYNTLTLDKLTDLIIDKEIEICFHLAAQVEVTNGFQNPYGTFDDNINLTLMLLESIRLSNTVRSLIFTSTDKVYGDLDRSKLPYQENYIPNPDTPYEISKYLCERLCIAYAKNYKIPIIITRACNIYGPGQLNLSAIIPSLILSAINKKEFIPRSDGKMTRDYLFIDEWVENLLKISEKNYYNPFYADIFNFGTNDPKSVLEISKIIYDKVDPKNTPKIINKFKNIKSSNEIIDQSLSSKKANAAFGFKVNTNFDDNIINTINWYSKYL